MPNTTQAQGILQGTIQNYSSVILLLMVAGTTNPSFHNVWITYSLVIQKRLKHVRQGHF